MKLFALLGLAAYLATPCSAATIIFGNFDFAWESGNGLLLTDPRGAPLNHGFISLVGIPQGSPVPNNITSLRHLARSPWLGDPVLISPLNSPGNIGFLNTPLTVENDGHWNDVPLYILIGDGRDIDISANFGFLKTGLTFERADFPPPPDAQFYQASAPDVLVGQVSSSEIPSSHNSINLTALRLVPEPSAVLLLGCGLVPLWQRRRARSGR